MRGLVALLLLCAHWQRSGEGRGDLCIHEDSKPEKGDLYRLDVIARIAGSPSGNSRMVTFLLEDKDGIKMGILDKNYRDDVTKKVDKMFAHWLAGEGSKPVTWATLVRCLRHSSLHTLADDIESAYCAVDDSPEEPDEEGSGSSAATDTKGYALVTWEVASTFIATVATVVAVYFGIQHYRSPNTPYTHVSSSGARQMGKWRPLPPEMHEIPSSKDVFECLLPLAAKWRQIGTLLGIKIYKLDNVAAGGGGPTDRLMGMLDEWLKQINPNPTWAELYAAVKVVDERKAEEIRARFTAKILI